MVRRLNVPALSWIHNLLKFAVIFMKSGQILFCFRRDQPVPENLILLTCKFKGISSYPVKEQLLQNILNIIGGEK